MLISWTLNCSFCKPHISITTVCFNHTTIIDDFNDSVLATLVKNEVVPDPFYGLENETIIDIADSGREYYTFWFFTTFQCKLVCNSWPQYAIIVYDFKL